VLRVDDSLMCHKLRGDLGAAAVVELSSGRAAIDFLMGAPRLDLVYVNLMLSDVLSFDVCAHIRITSVLVDLPMLVVNLRHQSDDKARAERGEATGFLAKPFSVMTLERTCAKWWSPRRPGSRPSRGGFWQEQARRR
jgi:CheY-like chemotaxis protein